nr:unnamed protein product [Callosobruchus analis]
MMHHDSDTLDFSEYFNNFYANNYKQWAYAFRKNCGINTNMHLESMHKCIKYFNLEGKVVKRLDKGIHGVLTYTRDKIVDRIIENIKGKNTYHITEIHK